MDYSPREIVEKLDEYIIGQEKAKKAVAIALRNRYRRSMLPKEIQEEITPKNIILKGPTGVGKTEIARRLAKLVDAPFVKVEATKFTEVGYVGRDCESMVRDLVEASIRMIKKNKKEKVFKTAEKNANEKLLEILLKSKSDASYTIEENKINLEKKLKDGGLEDEIIEIEAMPGQASIDFFDPNDLAKIDMSSLMKDLMHPTTKTRKVKVSEARKIFIDEQEDKLLDFDEINAEAIKKAENEGIIFIDEIDKIIQNGQSNHGPDVSKEGVQRDILPIVEGTTVNTKYGAVNTDYILFISAGAFHLSKLENMIPELQGRFPVSVELDNLTKEDFYKILTEPKNAIIKQYSALLGVDNIELEFDESALQEISYIAEKENETNENIGARRLQTILETVLEDVSFNASGKQPNTKVLINKEFIDKIFTSQIKKYNLNKYII